MLTDFPLNIEQRQSGVDVIELLDRSGYHVGAAAGFLAVACLLVFAVGWRRWVDHQASDLLAARLVPAALVASAGAMIIGYGFKGMLAIYLPGGINAGDHPAEGLYTLFMINDLAPFFAWWGVAAAAAGVAWLAFRERLVVRWVGAVGGRGERRRGHRPTGIPPRRGGDARRRAAGPRGAAADLAQRPLPSRSLPAPGPRSPCPPGLWPPPPGRRRRPHRPR